MARPGESQTIFTIDIGDAYTRSGVYHDGVATTSAVIPTPQGARGRSGNDHLMDSIRDLVSALTQSGFDMDALAVSASGIMTLQPKPSARSYGPFKNAELYVLAPNVQGLQYVPLLAQLEDQGFDVPIHVENDVNAALESVTDYEDAICINLGGGLGAAIKRNGKIQHPPGTWSCYEIGHGMRWDLVERLTRHCHCGNNGCLEAAIGGWAMKERYRVAPEAAPPEIYDAMREDVVDLLPQAIASLVQRSGIETVLLAGAGSVGYARGGTFLERLCEGTEQLVDGASVEMGLVRLKETAELQGAAMALLRNDVLVSSSVPAKN